jgi:hypothetical protein
VFALFDPSAMPPQIPLPNDLTRQPATAHDLAVESFSGPVDPASITPQSVIAVDLVTRMPLPIMVTVVDPVAPLPPNSLSVSPPPGGWPIGHRIAIAIVGNPIGVAGVGGAPVVASPAFYFARSAKPISNCSMPAPDCKSATPVLSLEQAINLEALREALAPVIEGFVAAGIPRSALAIVWTFTIGAA